MLQNVADGKILSSDTFNMNSRGDLFNTYTPILYANMFPTLAIKKINGIDNAPSYLLKNFWFVLNPKTHNIESIGKTPTSVFKYTLL